VLGCGNTGPGLGVGAWVELGENIECELALAFTLGIGAGVGIGANCEGKEADDAGGVEGKKDSESGS
jgi:hypothetical protein